MIRLYRLVILASAGMFLACATAAVSAQDKVASPFEDAKWTVPANAIDTQVTSTLAKHRLQLRNQCSDGVFIRRVYLDTIGTLPTPQETAAFFKDTRPDKRAALIESLFSRDEFADYWSMRWCDVLRVKSEFPINLWPNAVQAYHRWVRDAMKESMPYDQFARELLTSSGSNFRIAPVNFYRAVPARDPGTLAKAVALTFMGTRFERWSKARQDNLAAFFSKVAYKYTDEWKEEIVFLKPDAAKPIKTLFPDGSTAQIPGDADPRQIFTNWLTGRNNKWFARSVVNRMWGWTMGHGIIDEVDDIRPDNPPASPELLACLENELVKSNYDLRHILRLILNSRTYQKSSLPHNDNSDPKVRFAHYTLRQMDAEVLIDALDWIAGEGESYSSPTPEPYTFIPKENRSIALADGSITSSFLATFGRASRDTGLASERNSQPSDTQRLYLLNSGDLRGKINRSPILQAVFNSGDREPAKIIRGTYVVLMSRLPTSDEVAAALKYFQTKGLWMREAQNDLAWALINSKEFLYRH